MFARIEFEGPARYRLRSAAELARGVAEVSARRLLKGPRRPSWNWWIEVATELLKRQLITAFAMPDVRESRCYLDSMVVRSPALSDVTITPIAQENFNGSWFAPRMSSLARRFFISMAADTATTLVPTRTSLR